jgi:hypothetical protein
VRLIAHTGKRLLFISCAYIAKKIIILLADVWQNIRIYYGQGQQSLPVIKTHNYNK